MSREELVKSWLEHCWDMIEKHPIQAQNIDSFLTFADTAWLGVQVREFRSKGDFNVIPVGTPVLYIVSEHGATVWSAGSRCQSLMPSRWVREMTIRIPV